MVYESIIQHVINQIKYDLEGQMKVTPGTIEESMFAIDKINKTYGGDLEYVNHMTVGKYNANVYMYHAKNPDISKGHKPWMFLGYNYDLVTLQKQWYVSGLTEEEMEKERYHDGVKCDSCGDIIISTFRHDYCHCSCGESFVDGGKEYIRCGVKSSPVRIDYLNKNAVVETPVKE
jgi:hypothetical protein